MIVRPFAVLIATMTVLGCSGHTEKSVRGDHQQESGHPMAIVARQTSVPPGYCRIIGTLVSVDSTLEQMGPCSKAPCRGVVRVDSILGYGSAFGGPLAVKQQIDVQFTFTLAATTEDLFPTMTERLPGLHIGDRFETDVESRNEPGMRMRPVSYVIQQYRKPQ